jgi:hypothetical protein
MSDSTHLALPYIAAAQAQKHVTHNEAIRILDSLVMLSVKDRDLATPPGSPADGDRYIVAASGTGAWGGKDGQIADYRVGAWTFHAPREGWRAYVADEDGTVFYDGAAWVDDLTIVGDLTVHGVLGVGGTPFTRMSVITENTSSARGFSLTQHNDSGIAPQYVFYKSRGSRDSPTQVNDGDNTGAFFCRAYVNGEYRLMAAIGFSVNGTVSGNNAPTDIIFAPGAAVISGVASGEQFRFASSGDFKMGSSGGTTVINASRHPVLRSYTVATLPSAATAGQLIYVSNGTSNKRLAVSDGTNWRFPDGAVVS